VGQRLFGGEKIPGIKDSRGKAVFHTYKCLGLNARALSFERWQHCAQHQTCIRGSRMRPQSIMVLSHCERTAIVSLPLIVSLVTLVQKQRCHHMWLHYVQSRTTGRFRPHTETNPRAMCYTHGGRYYHKRNMRNIKHNLSNVIHVLESSLPASW